MAVERLEEALSLHHRLVFSRETYYSARKTDHSTEPAKPVNGGGGGDWFLESSPYFIQIVPFSTTTKHHKVCKKKIGKYKGKTYSDSNCPCKRLTVDLLDLK